MSTVSLKCPECQRKTVVNGNGACACGAVLVHHYHGKRKILKNAARTWFLVDGEWIKYANLR